MNTIDLSGQAEQMRCTVATVQYISLACPLPARQLAPLAAAVDKGARPVVLLFPARIHFLL